MISKYPQGASSMNIYMVKELVNLFTLFDFDVVNLTLSLS